MLLSGTSGSNVCSRNVTVCNIPLFSQMFFSSCVCPEQLVSWSISEATKAPFQNKDLKSHISDFPEPGAVLGEAVSSLAMHTGTLQSCLFLFFSILAFPTAPASYWNCRASLSSFPSWWSHLPIFSLFQFSFTSSQANSNVQRRKYCYPVPSAVSHCHYSCFFRIISLGAVTHYVIKPTFTYLQGEYCSA